MSPTFMFRAVDAFMAALFVLFSFGLFSIAAKEFRHAYDEAAIEAQLHPAAGNAAGPVRACAAFGDCVSLEGWAFY